MAFHIGEFDAVATHAADALLPGREAETIGWPRDQRVGIDLFEQGLHTAAILGHQLRVAAADDPPCKERCPWPPQGDRGGVQTQIRA